jgi:heme/copper-type cytochrome/quinol oxidase subunit 2
MATALASLLLAAEKSPAQEGRDIITAMLIVAFVFLGVIALGQTARYLSHRRAARKARSRRAY